MANTLDQYLEKIPEQFRSSLILLEEFKGNRTNVSFKFSCGCVTNQCFKAFLGRDNFEYCTKCKPKERKVNNQSSKFKNMIEGKDFVVCKVCGKHAKKLTEHLRIEHKLTPDQYDGPVLCESSKNKYSVIAKDNGNWIERAKANGDDLSDFKQKMSRAVREAILSNPDEIKRRAQVMSNVNRSDIMRKKASETAIKTSARKDIQEQRSAQLKKWRDENPDEFYEKCTSKMLDVFHSKPELELFKIVSQVEGHQFKLNQVIKSDLFISKSKLKQIDIGNKKQNIYIEFDGPLHFINTNLNQLNEVQQKDKLLDEHILKHEWILIRVSYDQFSYRSSDYGFKKECLEKLFAILDKPISGVHRIGENYE